RGQRRRGKYERCRRFIAISLSPPILLSVTPRVQFEVDYWIRRNIHATDHLWSTPHAVGRSRANGAPQSKLIPAPDRSVWLSIGPSLRAQHAALSPPVPPHITALVEQLNMNK